MPAGSFPIPTAVAVTLQVIEEVRQRQVRPVATYRLQLHAGFTLRDAAALVPYLRDLGISHVYCSPYLRARSGSTHGYDLCDHNQINPELGGEPAYREFVAALAEHGMGHILDMVPNHMAASTQNPWWYDVLENGPNSPYAHFFDIDWEPVKPELADKLLLPILGKQYGEVLEDRQLTIEYRNGAFLVRYFDNELPLGPKTVVPLLQHKLDVVRGELGPDHPHVIELESIITGLEHLPPQTARDLASVRERQREKEVIKRRLCELTTASEPIRQHIERAIVAYNGTQGEAQSFDNLDRLLDKQAYRLSHWRTAFDEINYRRFFDINELAAIAMEFPEVFGRSHVLIRSLLADGSLSGLRIDHIDGLFDPERYLLRLQWAYLADLAQRAFSRLFAEALAQESRPLMPEGASGGDAAFSPSPRNAPADDSGPARQAGPTNGAPVPPSEQAEWARAAPEVLRLCCEQFGLPSPQPDDLRAIFGADHAAEMTSTPSEGQMPSPGPGRGMQPLYVVTEKILGPDEPLPESWPVAGTTGYDFLATLNGLFVSSPGWTDIVRTFQRFTDIDVPYDEVVQDSKRLVLRIAMSSELLMLAHRLNRISEQRRRSRDLTLNMLRLAAREVLVSFPVYRVYPRKEGTSDRDRRFVDLAVTKAKRKAYVFDPAVFDFLRNVLLLTHPPELTPEAMADRELLAGKFQQVTSPVMAKGVEDTSFYVWVPLASVNEVGGDPRRPTTSPQSFHDHNRERRLRYPHAMLATTTHDTKRTEDLRARLNVLSEIPKEWRAAVQRFTRINKRWRREVDGLPAPSPKDEYLYYQSVIGIWPLTPPTSDERKTLIERLQGYMEKAIHEAKQQTSWLNPSRAYDEAVWEFVAQTLRDSPQNRFIAEVQALHDRIVDAGQYNALSQLALKLLSPGVPDIYQGQELFDYSLVDPDNRRPVNYSFAREALAQVGQTFLSASGPDARQECLPHFPLRDPRLKLLVTRRLLDVRHRLAHLWSHGEYMPLEVLGPLADHVVALAWRGAESHKIELIAAVPRFVQKLLDTQRGADIPVCQSCLPSQTWQGTLIVWPSGESLTATNIFTGQELTLGEPAIEVASLLNGFSIGVWETSQSEH